MEIAFNHKKPNAFPITPELARDGAPLGWEIVDRNVRLVPATWLHQVWPHKTFIMQGIADDDGVRHPFE